MRYRKITGIQREREREHNRFFKTVISKQNLVAAWREFLKDKKNKKDVVLFSERLEENLMRLHADLSASRYRHGGYSSFYLNDPKPRHIHKASVRDRLVHHAVHRVVEPLFESGFIFDAYSARRRKGTHAAVKRLHALAWRLSQNDTRTVWVLQCDIRRFFDSMDHSVLLSLLRTRLPDAPLMSLLSSIIESFHCTPGKGLPLGNLTSQLFANVYLNVFDQFIKRTLHVKAYVRYADDFAIISTSKDELGKILLILRHFLSRTLLLELHPQKVTIRKWHQGIDFLGVVNFPHHSVLRSRTKKRMFKKLVRRQARLAAEVINLKQYDASVQSYLGMLSHVRAKGLQKEVRNERNDVFERYTE